MGFPRNTAIAVFPSGSLASVEVQGDSDQLNGVARPIQH